MTGHRIIARPLTAAAFAPFGEALEARDTERAEDLVRNHALGLAAHVRLYADYLD